MMVMRIILFCALALSGCQSGLVLAPNETVNIPERPVKFKINSVRAEDLYDRYEKATGNGQYAIGGRGFEERVRSALASAEGLQPLLDDEGLDVDIEVRESFHSEGNGVLANVNNIFSVCTLTIWPFISSERYTYEVTLDSPIGKRNFEFEVNERYWTSVGPLALFPVPGASELRGTSNVLNERRPQVMANRFAKALIDIGKEVRIDSEKKEVRRAALSLVSDSAELRKLVLDSPFDDVRKGAVLRISDPRQLAEIGLNEKVERELRELAIEGLIGIGGSETHCTSVFLKSNETWLQLLVAKKIEKSRLGEKRVRDKLLTLWRTAELPIDRRAEIFLDLKGADMSAEYDQKTLAQALSSSKCWKSVFEKVASEKSITRQEILLRLALGNPACDESVIMWAVDNLPDMLLKTVILSSDVPGVREKAISRVKSEDVLSDLALSAGLEVRERDRVMAHLREVHASECCYKKVYLGVPDFRCAKMALLQLGNEMLGDVGVIARSLKWLRDEDVALSDRVTVFLLARGREYDVAAQRVVAKMLGLRDAWQDVLKKCDAEKVITDSRILMNLVARNGEVDEKVSLWALKGLQDAELMEVVGMSPAAKVAFMAVRQLRDIKSLEKVAAGPFGMVARIEAIGRLTAASLETLRKIAVSEEPDFREIALERIQALGLECESVRATAEMVAQQEVATQRAEDEKRRARQEAVVREAENDVALAKIDEKIMDYRIRLNSGVAEGANLIFTGKVMSIVSKAWKPKVRIEIKGAKLTLCAICHVPGRFDKAIKVGDLTIVEGVCAGGTESEVSLSCVRFSSCGGASK